MRKARTLARRLDPQRSPPRPSACKASRQRTRSGRSALLITALLISSLGPHCVPTQYGKALAEGERSQVWCGAQHASVVRTAVTPWIQPADNPKQHTAAPKPRGRQRVPTARPRTSLGKHQQSFAADPTQPHRRGAEVLMGQGTAVFLSRCALALQR